MRRLLTAMAPARYWLATAALLAWMVGGLLLIGDTP